MTAAATHAIAAPPLLRLDGVRLVQPSSRQDLLTQASLDVRAGELVMIRLSTLDDATHFADACVGLAKPARGVVQLNGVDWATLVARRAASLRACIGRVFAQPVWVNYLSIAENVMLAPVHHAAAPEHELMSRAARTATALGLPGLSLGRPGDLSLGELQRLALVRALLPEPSLLVLEEPLGVPPQIEPRQLVNSLHDARSRGAGIIVLTTSFALWRDPLLHPTRRLRVLSGMMEEA